MSTVIAQTVVEMCWGLKEQFHFSLFSLRDSFHNFLCHRLRVATIEGPLTEALPPAKLPPPMWFVFPSPTRAIIIYN